jgi:hypothetical protein
MADEKKNDGKEKAGAAKAAPAAEAAAGGTCLVDKCKQPVRAKGYCRKHFIAWRREELGEHHRYKTCSREGCRKRRISGSLCEEHAGTGAAKAEGAAT